MASIFWIKGDSKKLPRIKIEILNNEMIFSNELVLIVNGTKFNVHKFIIDKSKYLQQFKEWGDNEIKIDLPENMNIKMFDEYLKFLYGNREDINISHVIQICDYMMTEFHDDIDFCIKEFALEQLISLQQYSEKIPKTISKLLELIAENDKILYNPLFYKLDEIQFVKILKKCNYSKTSNFYIVSCYVSGYVPKSDEKLSSIKKFVIPIEKHDLFTRMIQDSIYLVSCGGYDIRKNFYEIRKKYDKDILLLIYEQMFIYTLSNL